MVDVMLETFYPSDPIKVGVQNIVYALRVLGCPMESEAMQAGYKVLNRHRLDNGRYILTASKVYRHLKQEKLAKRINGSHFMRIWRNREETLENTSYEVFKRMGSIIEFPAFYEHMSGRDNLKLHCEYMGYYSRDSLTEALEMLGLLEAADKPVKRYSLGMKQRLGIARAILCKPELVVLDEPTNGLDPAGMKQIRDLFRMLKEEYGMTFLISSHLLSEIESIADTIGIISHGKLLREISMQEISEMNTAYIELTVENTQKAAYILSEKLNLNNFKIMDDSRIRIYEPSAAAQSVSKELLINGVEMISITKHTESLEDYFLKLTEEVEQSC